ncbi:MAG: Hint domain-containing protein [Paracoccaceae bacterium]
MAGGAGWIGLTDRTSGWFHPEGLSRAAGGASAPCGGALLTRGTLLLETRLSPDGRPQTLLAIEQAQPWRSHLSLRAIPGGGIVVVAGQGDRVFHCTLALDAEARTDVLRIAYSWDAPARQARLTVERPEHDRPRVVEARGPLPVPMEAMRRLACEPWSRRLDPDVIFVAVSDRVEPVGPMPSLTGRVPVDTPRGWRPVSALRRGDLVRTRGSGPVPVLATLRHALPARGSFRPIRLRAPYFGLLQDIVVAPGQRLVIGGSHVEYMFGHEAVLVPARHLVNGSAAVEETGPLVVTYHQLLLPEHEALIAAGTGAESLNIGRLRRRKDLLGATLMGPLPRDWLPDHAMSAYPVLKCFEAVSLAEERAA